ncbi:MAG: hypothetical protein DMG05_13380 [Acidobacteria bacterium]|nr:MAG: hypothetical protein DMG05_13380 [Acidobacteriota bacterium]
MSSGNEKQQGKRDSETWCITKSGSWNCHGVTESTEPVEKRERLLAFRNGEFRGFVLTPKI